MCRAVRYDDIYRMDEIKSIVSYYVLSFISWCRKIHCLRYVFIIWMTAIFTRHHGTWRGDRSRWRTTRTKRGTTSVAWARVFKHCSFKTTDVKLLKRKQQRYVCTVSVSMWEDHAFVFAALLALNDYINTLMRQIPRLCKYPHKHSDLGLKKENSCKRKSICNSVLDPDFGLKGEAVQYSFCLPFLLIIAHC